MKTRNQGVIKLIRWSTALGSIIGALVARPTFGQSAQGSLPPQGTPSSAIKSPGPIEARTPVDATHTPGNAETLFRITRPGSYYLTGNITGVSNKYGIEILADNVTFELNGFSLLGKSNALSGINVPNGYANIIVRDGTISGYSLGIRCSAANATMERLTISSSATYGVLCGDACVVRDCTVNGNSLQGVYVAGSGCLIIGNNCIGNNTANVACGAGIFVAGSNNRIEGNHVTACGASGKGIFILSSASFTNNIVIKNSVEGGGVNNYFIPVNNDAGPIGSASALTSTWGNISH